MVLATSQGFESLGILSIENVSMLDTPVTIQTPKQLAMTVLGIADFWWVGSNIDAA